MNPFNLTQEEIEKLEEIDKMAVEQGFKPVGIIIVKQKNGQNNKTTGVSIS